MRLSTRCILLSLVPSLFVVIPPASPAAMVVAQADPGVVGRRVAIAGLADGSSHVVAIDGSGKVFHRVRRADGTWTDFAGLNGLGTLDTASASAVSVAGLPDGSVQVAIDGDGGVFHRERRPDGTWSQFAPLNGRGTTSTAQASAVAIAGLPDGSSHVVIIGAGGATYHRVRYPSGHWSEFAPLNGVGTSSVALGTAVAVAGLPDGSAQVSIVGTDGNVYHRVRHPNGSWTEFSPLRNTDSSQIAKGSAVAIAGLPDGSSQMLIVSLDGSVLHSVRQASGHWSTFRGLNGMGTTGAAKGTAVAIAGLPDGSSQVLIAGADGGIYHRQRRPDKTWSEFAAMATPTPWTTDGRDPGGAVFVKNGASYQTGDVLNEAQLTALGVRPSALDDQSWGRAPISPRTSSPGTPVPGVTDSYTFPEFNARDAYSYVVRGTWKTQDNRTGVVRQGRWDGVRGFGLDKIEQFHNVGLAHVRTATQYPRPGPTGNYASSGTSRWYETDVLHVRCGGWWIFRTCKVVETRVFKALMEFRLLDDGKPVGVITAYCVGSTLCPEWVRSALNV